MVAEKVVINALKDAMSLNSYESKVWRALLSRGISSASELADISGVPRSRCYDVLEGLEKKGFVFMKIGKPIKYIAIEPQEVIETLKKGTRVEQNRVTSLLDSIKDTDFFGDLQSLYSTGIQHIDSNEISSSIIGKTDINQFLKGMFARASKQVTIHTNEHNVKRKLSILKKSVGKNVAVTIKAPTNHPTPLKNVKFEKGENGMRYIHVDDDELLFFTSPHEVEPEHESVVWVKSKFVTDAIKNLIQ